MKNFIFTCWLEFVIFMIIDIFMVVSKKPMEATIAGYFASLFLVMALGLMLPKK